MQVTGVMTQGRGSGDNDGEWVRSFMLSYSLDADPSSWLYVRDLYRNQRVCIEFDSSVQSTALLPRDATYASAQYAPCLSVSVSVRHKSGILLKRLNMRSQKRRRMTAEQKIDLVF